MFQRLLLTVLTCHFEEYYANKTPKTRVKSMINILKGFVTVLLFQFKGKQLNTRLGTHTKKKDTK